MKNLYLPLVSSIAFALCATAQTPTPAARSSSTPASTNADNTARNVGDAKKEAPTADKQPNNADDLKLVQSIRKGVMDEKALSMDAKNCKIIVANGTVTLRGPVDSAQEKKSIADIAMRFAGAGKVTDELEVKAPKK